MRNLAVIAMICTGLFLTQLQLSFSDVVINEIHYHPTNKTAHVCFVELHNSGSNRIDLGGWYFSQGVSYTFPSNSMLPSGQYVIVAEDPSAIKKRFKVAALGPYAGNLARNGELLELRNAVGVVEDRVRYQLGFPWPTVGDNGCSIQFFNPAFDNSTGGNWRSAPPTPLHANSAIWTNNPPPCMEDIHHNPKQPMSKDKVIITAKVTASNSVADVTLHYQIVEPGKYISSNDSAYATDWTSLNMRDDGKKCDKKGADGIFTVEMPKNLQRHRRLIRYRITATDRMGNSITVPYPDDPQPNFAYFVYDGVPAWRGAVQPGVTESLTFGTNVMRSLPVYHLLTKNSDVWKCTWPDSWEHQYWSRTYPWCGTLVYDGEVYDHIHFRARGGHMRYKIGKNMWKFDFNRGHYFQARDNYGRKYHEKRNKLNLTACCLAKGHKYRGEAGMFEAVTFALFNLAGVPAPKTHWIQFRVIDDKKESGKTQYDGDFWGLYLVVEQPDGHFLDEHDLPDGNLYKIVYARTAVPNNVGTHGPTDRSDYQAFIMGYENGPTLSWWRSNVNLESYYSYRTIVDSVHHYDITPGRNYYLYLNPVPVTNQWGTNYLWMQLPWDVNLTWADDAFGAGISGSSELFRSLGLLSYKEFNLEFKNRLREIRDLLFNEDQTYGLINEYASILCSTTGGLSIVDADRAMWDFNPIMTNSNYVIPYEANQGEFYRRSPTKDFAGMVKIMKDYVPHRCKTVLDPMSDDPDIPDTPVICPVADSFSMDNLTFVATEFKSRTTNTFRSIKWRMAEVTDTNSPAFDESKARKYEIEADWEGLELTNCFDTMTIPQGIAKPGHTYRVRARVKDNTGRCSHWSDPYQFTMSEPTNITALLCYLGVSELMYNAKDGNDYDFVELHNTGTNVALDLAGVTFTAGIHYTFPAGSTIPPDGCVLLTKASTSDEIAAFRRHYGLSDDVFIYGPYRKKLDKNKGRLILKTGRGGAIISSFSYGGDEWPSAARGGGYSLVPMVMSGQTNGILDHCENWRASSHINGSPGHLDPPPSFKE